MANLWQYETLSAKREVLKDELNRLGKLGYQVIHLTESDAGQYFLILARDTGRPIDEGEDRHEEWLVDVVTGESQLDGT